MGIGRTMPEPTESILFENKIEVPSGKPVPSNVDDTSLLYNEYPFFIINNMVSLNVYIIKYKIFYYYYFIVLITFWYISLTFFQLQIYCL